MVQPDLDRLPPPFRDERFRRLRHGVHDDPEIDVHINEAGDFAFLDPLPTTDYVSYTPRARKLGLEDYRRQLGVYSLRYANVAAPFEAAASVLEVVSGDGGFLAFVHDLRPQALLACVEPDQASRARRDALPWLVQYGDAAEIGGQRFDLICMFHVLEHILDPLPFLARWAALLGPGGRLIIEVPSLDDPLRGLYAVPAYEDFLFQRQHPYCYAASSLRRLLEGAGYGVGSMIHHQRYGLENHLTWMRHGVPGGDPALRGVLADADGAYRASLEGSGHADTVIAVVESGP